uniref:Peptidase S1 domain-containing protein n=1 Tax=Monopterus albus TaxID=43700 RepID=A0A3Q3QW10_MONAL
MAAWTVWILLMCAVLNGQVVYALSDCGVAPLNTKIVGGVNATAGSWPWQVSVHFTGYHICGGTLISDQWVLTAAHCIIKNSTSVWTLYFGKLTQSGPNANQVTRTVSQIIVHPNYNNTWNNNDIALMKLSSRVTFNDYIRPVCLASNSSQFYTSTSCWATGWGRLGKPNQAYNFLQEVQIPVVGNKQCSCDYIPEPKINLTANMLCAGQVNKGTCQGDSGGPLQCKQGSVWIQAGITSYGVPCATAGFPEVYTRVSRFQAWIKAHVAGTNVIFVTFTSSGTDPDNNSVCLSTHAITPAPTSIAKAIATEFLFIVTIVAVFLQHILAQ